MEITEVKVFPIQEEKLKAFVSIVFDQCFMVNDIKIIQGRDGLFISMPSRKKKNGEFKDVAHPLNNETRRMIEDKVLAEYERVLGGRDDRADHGDHGDHGDVPAASARPALTVVPPMSSPAAALSTSPAAATLLSGEIGSSVARRPAIAAASAVAAVPSASPAPSSEAAAAAPAIATIAPSAPLAPSAPAVEKTLDEIEEMHLRDSFWTVT
jgi:stage V sporulation protein G